MRFIALVFLLLLVETQIIASDFDTVSSFIEESVEGGVVAGGSLLILERGLVAYESGFGYADIESRNP